MSLLPRRVAWPCARWTDCLTGSLVASLGSTAAGAAADRGRRAPCSSILQRRGHGTRTGSPGPDARGWGEHVAHFFRALSTSPSSGASSNSTAFLPQLRELLARAPDAAARWHVFTELVRAHDPHLPDPPRTYAAFLHAALPDVEEDRYVSALLEGWGLSSPHHAARCIHHLLRLEAATGTSPHLSHYLFHRFTTEHPDCCNPHVYAAMINTLTKFSGADAEHLCKRAVALGLDQHPVVQVARGKLLAGRLDHQGIAALGIQDASVQRYLTQRASLEWRGELAKVQDKYEAWRRQGSPPLQLPPAPGQRERALIQDRLALLRTTFGTDNVHLALLLDALGIQRQAKPLARLWSMLRSMGYPFNVNHYTSYAEGLAYQADLPGLLVLLLEEMPRANVPANVKLFRNVIGALFSGGGRVVERRGMARTLVLEVLRPRYPSLEQTVMEQLRLPDHLKAIYFDHQSGPLSSSSTASSSASSTTQPP